MISNEMTDMLLVMTNKIIDLVNDKTLKDDMYNSLDNHIRGFQRVLRNFKIENQVELRFLSEIGKSAEKILKEVD